MTTGWKLSKQTQIFEPELFQIVFHFISYLIKCYLNENVGFHKSHKRLAHKLLLLQWHFLPRTMSNISIRTDSSPNVRRLMENQCYRKFSLASFNYNNEFLFRHIKQISNFFCKNSAKFELWTGLRRNPFKNGFLFIFKCVNIFENWTWN